MAARARPRRRGPRAVVRNRRGLSTRGAILAAAQRLLAERGLEAVSLDGVARAAGVSRSSVYHQFHSRDGLFLQLIAESLRGLQREHHTERAHVSNLARFLDEAAAGFRGDPNLLRMFYLLVFDRDRSRPEVKQLLREAYRFRTRRLAEGLRRDGFAVSPADLESLAVVLAAVLDGLYARTLVDLEGPRLRRAFAFLSRLVAGLASPRGGRTRRAAPARNWTVMNSPASRSRSVRRNRS